MILRRFQVGASVMLARQIQVPGTGVMLAMGSAGTVVHVSHNCRSRLVLVDFGDPLNLTLRMYFEERDLMDTRGNTGSATEQPVARESSPGKGDILSVLKACVESWAKYLPDGCGTKASLPWPKAMEDARSMITRLEGQT